MSDDRQVVLQTRRNGDSTAPTISDVVIGDLKLVFFERPRTPLPGDFIEGAAHPCVYPDLKSGESVDVDVNWTENVHPKHPFCYELMNIPGRTAILQHAANVFDELEGCQAPGTMTAQFAAGGIRPGMPHRAMLGVVQSGPALGMLQDKLCRKNYRLRIVEA